MSIDLQISVPGQILAVVNLNELSLWNYSCMSPQIPLSFIDVNLTFDLYQWPQLFSWQTSKLVFHLTSIFYTNYNVLIYLGDKEIFYFFNSDEKKLLPQNMPKIYQLMVKCFRTFILFYLCLPKVYDPIRSFTALAKMIR